MGQVCEERCTGTYYTYALFHSSDWGDRCVDNKSPARSSFLFRHSMGNMLTGTLRHDGDGTSQPRR